MAENNNNSVQELNEILQVRRDKLSAMVADGKDPFVKTKYDVTAYSTEIKADYDGFEGKEVSLAGRIIARRIMGKASFVTLRDGEGDIQLYVSRDDVGEDVYAAFKKWDIGDIMGVKGIVFTTRTGEISVHAIILRCWQNPCCRCPRSSTVLQIMICASVRDMLILS